MATPGKEVVHIDKTLTAVAAVKQKLKPYLDQTKSGGFGSRLARFIPVASLRTRVERHFEQAPLDALRRRIFEILVSLHIDIQELQESGSQFIDFCRVLSNLVEQAERDPENAGIIGQIQELMNARAEAALRRQGIDAQAREFSQAFLKAVDPSVIRSQVLREATFLLSTLHPIRDTLVSDVLLVQEAILKMKSRFAQVDLIAEAALAVRHSIGDALDAVQANAMSPAAIVGEISGIIEATKAVSDIQALVTQTQGAVGTGDLQVLEERAYVLHQQILSDFSANQLGFPAEYQESE